MVLASDTRHAMPKAPVKNDSRIKTRRAGYDTLRLGHTLA